MRTAIVLFNLGGPDRLESVRPFLFNLFRDPAILRLPALLRLPLAFLIAKRREKKAQGIYEQLGGGSPLVPNTKAQADALQAALSDLGDVRVFFSMRYWHPLTDEVAQQVADYAPDQIVLLPLYPQFSTTTTASSLKEWRRLYLGPGQVRTLRCYPEEDGFIAANADLIRGFLLEARQHGTPRLLFSAHGLPEKVVKGGDPYQHQCERTAKAILAALGEGMVEGVNCYQSRVGPLRWIGPSTEAEILRAGREGRPVLVVPMSFVSEHSETLVEIEHDYRALATANGVPYFARIPAVGTHPRFIEGLAAIVRQTLSSHAPGSVCPPGKARLCPASFEGCPHAV